MYGLPIIFFIGHSKKSMPIPFESQDHSSGGIASIPAEYLTQTEGDAAYVNKDNHTKFTDGGEYLRIQKSVGQSVSGTVVNFHNTCPKKLYPANVMLGREAHMHTYIHT